VGVEVTAGVVSVSVGVATTVGVVVTGGATAMLVEVVCVAVDLARVVFDVAVVVVLVVVVLVVVVVVDEVGTPASGSVYWLSPPEVGLVEVSGAPARAGPELSASAAPVARSTTLSARAMMRR
jgi:hypothetical protein